LTNQGLTLHIHRSLGHSRPQELKNIEQKEINQGLTLHIHRKRNSVASGSMEHSRPQKRMRTTINETINNGQRQKLEQRPEIELETMALHKNNNNKNPGHSNALESPQHSVTTIVTKKRKEGTTWDDPEASTVTSPKKARVFQTRMSRSSSSSSFHSATSGVSGNTSYASAESENEKGQQPDTNNSNDKNENNSAPQISHRTNTVNGTLTKPAIVTHTKVEIMRNGIWQQG
jgi:hypothetical protein